MSRFLRYGWLLAALPGVALALSTLTGCGEARSESKLEPPAREPSSVESTRPERARLSRTVEQPGHIEGFEQTVLAAKVGGYVKELFVDMGDAVTPGQVLARLSVP